MVTRLGLWIPGDLGGGLSPSRTELRLCDEETIVVRGELSAESVCEADVLPLLGAHSSGGRLYFRRNILLVTGSCDAVPRHCEKTKKKNREGVTTYQSERQRSPRSPL